LWHRFPGDPHARGAPLTREELIAKTFPIEKKFFALGERYVNAADTDVGNLARALFVHNQHFFTFVHEEGVAPTNNVANATGGIWQSIFFGRAFFGRRRGARSLGSRLMMARRDGGQKMPWTKPLHRRSAMGIE
jgi:hypothetical protein